MRHGVYQSLLWMLILPSVWCQETIGAEQEPTVIGIGSRRELFVDHYLTEKLSGAALVAERPRDVGLVLRFVKPWEGAFCGYATVIRDDALYRLYYRGLPRAGADGSSAEATCYAESADGLRRTKPELGILVVAGSKANNVVLAGLPPFSHNFSPMLDNRTGVPRAERYKALAGTSETGLFAFESKDGLHWGKFRERPVLTQSAFDSLNVASWSETERLYLCYLRVSPGGVRRVAWATSSDFLSWSEPVLMSYGDRPVEHLYTS
jgi:hypothetical protein